MPSVEHGPRGVVSSYLLASVRRLAKETTLTTSSGRSQPSVGDIERLREYPAIGRFRPVQFRMPTSRARRTASRRLVTCSLARIAET